MRLTPLSSLTVLKVSVMGIVIEAKAPFLGGPMDPMGDGLMMSIRGNPSTGMGTKMVEEAFTGFRK
jgi:hypothetical protein